MPRTTVAAQACTARSTSRIARASASAIKGSAATSSIPMPSSFERILSYAIAPPRPTLAEEYPVPLAEGIRDMPTALVPAVEWRNRHLPPGKRRRTARSRWRLAATGCGGAALQKSRRPSRTHIPLAEARARTRDRGVARRRLRPVRRPRPDSGRADANAPAFLARLPATRLSSQFRWRSSGVGQEGRRTVEMTNDLEHVLFAPLGRLRGQQSSDPVMIRAHAALAERANRRPPEHGHARIDTSRRNGRSVPDGALPRDRQ